MKKLLIVLGVLVVVGAGVLVMRHRPLTLPGMAGPLGILPDQPGEVHSRASLHAALGDSNPGTRREALRSVGRFLDHGKLSEREVVPLLVAGTRDEDAGVRAVGTAYLSHHRIAVATSVPALVRLLKDANGLVRMNAANGLRKHAFKPEIKEAVPALIEALNDSDPDTRKHAAGALVHTPEARYQPPTAWRTLSPEAAREQVRTMGLRAGGDALHDAVSGDDVAGVFLLLNAGMSANVVHSQPGALTPLCLVGPRTRPEIVRFLLDAGADLDAKSAIGLTAAQHFSRNWELAGGTGPFADENLAMLKAARARAGSCADPGRRIFLYRALRERERVLLRGHALAGRNVRNLAR
jgi:hypothetical protein